MRVVDGRVTVRPLAGTRRRGATDEEDRRLAEELLADPKERAEHVMLVDLGRNDVGRVARYRTVEADRRHDHRALQPRHAHHLERHRPIGRGTRRLRRPAGLPAGRHRLRRTQGPGDGDHRRNRAAPPRTVCRRGRLRRLRRQHGHLHRPADARRARIARPTSKSGPESWPTAIPASEYQETLNKARGLLKAIEVTERRTREQSRR